MSNYFKDLGLIYENINNVVIGYHGSEGNDKFDRPNMNGIWFAEDKDSDIINYYSGRGKLITAKIKLGENLDLSMYNTDEKMNDSYARGFLIDMELDDNTVNDYINVFFYQEMETDYDEFTDEPVSTASMMLNYIIQHEFIPKKLYDSVSIMEGDEHLTHCILDNKNIEIISVV
jgi:hypothetical protein